MSLNGLESVGAAADKGAIGVEAGGSTVAWTRTAFVQINAFVGRAVENVTRFADASALSWMGKITAYWKILIRSSENAYM